MTDEEYIEIINSLILQQENEYSKTTEKLRNYYLTTREYVLENDLSKLKSVNPTTFYEILLFVSKAFILFPDRKATNKLRKWGISSDITRWFISLKKIEKRFKIIDNKDILICKNQAIVNIVLFLQTKISAGILKQLKSILELNEYPDIFIKKAIDNYFKRSKYKRKLPGKIRDILEYWINENAKILEEFSKNRKKAKILLKKLIEGKTETIFLNNLLYCFIPKKNLEQTEFLSSLSGIFKLISKERVIWTEVKYEDRESSYENNYKRYLARRIIHITNFKPGKDDLRQILVHKLFTP